MGCVTVEERSDAAVGEGGKRADAGAQEAGAHEDLRRQLAETPESLRVAIVPHPARLISVERERVHRRQTLFTVLWTVVFAGPFFATAMGAAVPVLAQVAKLSDRWYGLLQALPALALLVQIPGALLVSRLAHRPRAVMWLVVTSRLLWVPVAAVPLVLDPGKVATATFLTLVSVSWVLAQLGGLAWQAMVTDLVPRKKRGAYFGTRTRLLAGVNLVCSLALAFTLPRADQEGAAWLVLAIFTFGSCIGAAEGLWYRHSLDPKPSGKRRGGGRGALRFVDLLKPLTDRKFLPFLMFGFLIAASNGIVGPFLWRHFLNAQAMVPWKVTLILQTAALVGMLATAALWGKYVDRYGTKATILVAIVGGQMFTMMWPLVNPEMWWLGVVVQFAGVAMWVGLDVALGNRLYGHGSTGGPGYFAVFNAVLAAAGFGFTVLGGEIAERLHDAGWIKWLGEEHARWGLSFNVYMLLLAMCIALRVLAMIVVMRLFERDRQGMTTARSAMAITTDLQAQLTGVAMLPYRRIRALPLIRDVFPEGK